MADSYPTTPGVTFKDIPGYPGYCAGDDVSVWSAHKRGPGETLGEWHRLKFIRHHQGYLLVTLVHKKRAKMIGVHVVMLMTFVGPRPEGMEACHYPDRDPTNCSLNNLRWGTKVENSAHRYEQGTSPAGSNNGRAVLTEEQVREVRKLLAIGCLAGAIAVRYGVNVSTIQAIAYKKSWNSIK